MSPSVFKHPRIPAFLFSSEVPLLQAASDASRPFCRVPRRPEAKAGLLTGNVKEPFKTQRFGNIWKYLLGIQSILMLAANITYYVYQCMCTYTHTYIYIYIYLHTNVYIYIHVCVLI